MTGTAAQAPYDAPREPAGQATPEGSRSGSAQEVPPAREGFDPNAHRRSVLAPMLAAGAVSVDDPFRLLGVDISCDDTALLRERLVEVVGFWQRERTNPRYKAVVAELVRHRAELEAVLLDPQRRALARLRVQGVRRAQESARTARLDRLIKAVVARHGGVPAERVPLLRALARREGVSEEQLQERLAAGRVLPEPPRLPDALRAQVRSSLDELALRGDRARSASLWAFLGLSADATTPDIEAQHAALVADNLGRAHDRDKTVTGELLAHAKALLVDPAVRETYVAALVLEVQDRVADRVLELAVVDGELWPTDIELLAREVLSLGTGLDPAHARRAVRGAAIALGVPVTLPDGTHAAGCPTCGRVVGAASAPAPSPLHSPVPSSLVGAGSNLATPATPVGGAGAGGPAGSTGSPWSPATARPAPLSVGRAAPARSAEETAQEWREVKREVGLRRLVHATQRLARLARAAPQSSGPAGTLPEQHLAGLQRQVFAAREATERALLVEEPPAREIALQAVLDAVVDLDEAQSALAALPAATPTGLRAVLTGTTMALGWDPPVAAPNTTSWDVVRVVRTADGRRLEHPLATLTRCEAVDDDLPHASLVWHEVTAVVGARRSAAAATEPQPVVDDVTALLAAQGDGVVTLTWSAPPGGDIVVERREPDDPAAGLRRSRARGSRWRDTDVVAGARYRYLVCVEAAVGGVVARTPGRTVELVVDEPGAPRPDGAAGTSRPGSRAAAVHLPEQRAEPAIVEVPMISPEPVPTGASTRVGVLPSLSLTGAAAGAAAAGRSAAAPRAQGAPPSGGLPVRVPTDLPERPAELSAESSEGPISSSGASSR